MQNILDLIDFNTYYQKFIVDNPVLSYFENLGYSIYDWVLVFAVLFVLIEIIDDVIERRMDGHRIGEIFSNIFTQIPFYLSEVVVFGGIVFGYFYLYEFIPWKLPTNGLTAVIALLLADFTYYVEHYFMHHVRMFWLAHSVHHSSPTFNTSTAFRFSFLDPIISGLFHLPLVLTGINPVLILMGEVLVQAYQFWIHNEMIGKLGVLEEFLNTPSHHRVHHGSDNKYLDKNFGGILIIWDRIFGTFQREEELPTYGLTTPINTINPIKVQFFEFFRLGRDLVKTKSLKNKFLLFVKGPGWEPETVTSKNNE